MPRKKTVVPANVAAALTDDKPRAARVVTVLANPAAANDNPAAPVNDNAATVRDTAANHNADAVNDNPANDNADVVNENPSALAPLTPDSVAVPAPASVESLMSKDVETLTAEILALEAHGVSVILEIGKRLIAAKDKLSHGDWLPWLERVNISPRYAQRYMRLAREWTNATTLSYLGMSKALSLLAIPGDERDDFIAESHIVNGEAMSVDTMSVRELNDAIAARKDAEKRLEETQSRLDELQSRLDECKSYNQTLYHDLNDAAAQRDALQTELDELKAKPVDVAIEKVPDPVAIENAKREVREELQSLINAANISRDNAEKSSRKAHADLTDAQRKIDEANTERDKLKISCNKLNADLEFVTQERNAERERVEAAQNALDDANKSAKKAAQDAENVRAELERVRADAESRLKSATLADSDLTLFAVLFEQVKATVNQMQGIVMKRSDEKRESMKNALLSISDQIRKAAES